MTYNSWYAIKPNQTKPNQARAWLDLELADNKVAAQHMSHYATFKC